MAKVLNNNKTGVCPIALEGFKKDDGCNQKCVGVGTNYTKTHTHTQHVI